jgi:hypothetical protein
MRAASARICVPDEPVVSGNVADCFSAATRLRSTVVVAERLPDAYYGSVLRGALTVDILDPVGVYVATTAGDVFVSADGGDSWQTLSCRLPRVLSVAAYADA